jgi:hypothetical protein
LSFRQYFAQTRLPPERFAPIGMAILFANGMDFQQGVDNGLNGKESEHFLPKPFLQISPFNPAGIPREFETILCVERPARTTRLI